MYVVTNNHYRGQAAANAIMLSAMSRGSKQAAPAPLVETYSEALRPFVVEEEGTQPRLL